VLRQILDPLTDSGAAVRPAARSLNEGLLERQCLFPMRAFPQVCLGLILATPKQKISRGNGEWTKHIPGGGHSAKALCKPSSSAIFHASIAAGVTRRRWPLLSFVLTVGIRSGLQVCDMLDCFCVDPKSLQCANDEGPSCEFMFQCGMVADDALGSDNGSVTLDRRGKFLSAVERLTCNVSI
jgi:hypothetical protein